MVARVSLDAADSDRALQPCAVFSAGRASTKIVGEDFQGGSQFGRASEVPFRGLRAGFLHEISIFSPLHRCRGQVVRRDLGFLRR